jgi:hypothetical protein
MTGKVRLAPESLDPDGEPSEATVHGLSRLLPRSRGGPHIPRHSILGS